MESKKILEKYVGPSVGNRIFFWLLLGLAVMLLVLGLTAGDSDGELWIVLGITTLAMWLIYTVVVLMPVLRLNKCVKLLEASGELDAAAKALESHDTYVIGNNKGRISGGYLFGKNTGMVVRVKDLMWCYKQIQRVWFIPTNASLIIYTMDHSLIPAVIYGKNDRYQELEQAMLYLQKENPGILLGFNRENQKAYKAAKKAAKV